MATIGEQIWAAEQARNAIAKQARLAWQTYNDLDRQIDELNDEIRELRKRQRSADAVPGV